MYSFFRMRMYQTIASSFPERDLSHQIRSIQPVVQKWKGRCSAQLDLVGICSSNSIFQMVPPVEQEMACPFSISDAYDGKTYYVTPGCVVYVAKEDAFYDPCR